MLVDQITTFLLIGNLGSLPERFPHFCQLVELVFLVTYEPWLVIPCHAFTTPKGGLFVPMANLWNFGELHVLVILVGKIDFDFYIFHHSWTFG